MYKYIHKCIYIHISCPHTYTHTHIYTHAYKMYIWTHAKHVWNDGAAAIARAAQLDTKKLCPSPCPHHDSAPSRPHPLICTGAEPSSLSTPAPSLGHGPRNEVIVLPFWRGLMMTVCIYTYMSIEKFTSYLFTHPIYIHVYREVDITVPIHVCVYIYIYTSMYIPIYIYIYR